MRLDEKMAPTYANVRYRPDATAISSAGVCVYRVAWFANPLNPLVRPSSSDMPMSTNTLDWLVITSITAELSTMATRREDQRPAHPAAGRHHPGDDDTEPEQRKQDETDS